ncbi:MAG: universal stress protein [Bdellovibrionales bacterium]|nr:universal stress protein [Bdellovibrionales bacterium]
MKNKAKILWALDPFHFDHQKKAHLGNFLNYLSEAENSKIEPVYVLGPDSINWTGEFSSPWSHKYRPLAKEAANNVIEKLQCKNIIEPQILVNSKASLRSAVKKIVSHAQANRSSFIVVHSHGRRSVERFFLGSFAETLLLQSQTPVLLLKENHPTPTQFKNVLFPTDFSATSHKALKKLLPRLKKWGSHLTLFHKLPDPIEPVVQSGVFMAGGGWVSLTNYFEKDAEFRKKKIEKLQKEAALMGVSTKVVVENHPGLTTELILQSAKKEEIDLIAMATQSGPVSRILLGSVARQLSRESDLPLLIFR